MGSGVESSALAAMDQGVAESTRKLNEMVAAYRKSCADQDPTVARYRLALSLLALPNSPETIAVLVDTLTVAVAKLAERED